MRFVHTSDWHLGRLFHGRHLTEDQAHVLDQLVALLAREKPDALLISGDVYDRAVPPVEAVRLLDDVLRRIVIELGIPVIAIAGNHDDGDRLAFGSSFLRERGLHVVGTAAEGRQVVPLEDEHGTVLFHPVPYAVPAEVRVATGQEDIHTHDAAMRALVARIPPVANTRTVLLAHAFVAGGSESESERPLSVGGSGAVGSDAFEGFDYVALGHLHRPQQAGGEHVRYSGSLLKYSFNEADHDKAVLLVDMDADGHCTVEPIALSPRRDVRVLAGRLEDLLRGPAHGESADDYVLARLTDRDALLNPMGKLREVYPNTLQIERAPTEPSGTPAVASEHQQRLPTRDLFAAFFEEVTGETLAPDAKAALLDVLASVERAAGGGA